MHTADTLLNRIPDRGKRQRPRDDGDRQLSHPAMSLRSYAKLDKNQGALTPGSTADTVDGLSTAKMPKISEAIRQEKGPGTPGRRLLQEQPQGGKRPRGRPRGSDKGGQARVCSLLEAS
jgi:hypothetical protein